MVITYSRWTFLHATGLLVSLGLQLLLSLPLLLTFSALSFTLFCFSQFSNVKDLGYRGNWANLITLVRLLLILLLVMLSEGMEPHYLQAGFLLALLLDGVDGYVARKTGSISDTGAKFDMEVDAFFVLVLTLFLSEKNSQYTWLIGLGVLRYTYVILLQLLSTEEKKEPVSYFKKAVTVLTLGILIVLLFLPHVWLTYLAYLSVIGISISFIHSLVFQITGKWLPIF